MKHMTEEELVAYRDGEAKSASRFAAHLQECAECREEMERIEAVFAALDAMPVPDPGEDYGRRVWQQIAPTFAGEDGCELVGRIFRWPASGSRRARWRR